MMQSGPRGPISYRAEQAEVSWRSDPLKCSICFSELTTAFLRTSCDHVLCKIHEREPNNDLPHRCPACKKSLTSECVALRARARGLPASRVRRSP